MLPFSVHSEFLAFSTDNQCNLSRTQALYRYWTKETILPNHTSLQLHHLMHQKQWLQFDTESSAEHT